MSDLREFVGPNAGYLAELYEYYQKDPSAVSAEIREFLETHLSELEGAAPRPSGPSRKTGMPAKTAAPVEEAQPPRADVSRFSRLLALVTAIRERGHLAASLDPLGLESRSDPLLTPEAHGLSEAELQSFPAEWIESPLAAGASSAAEVVRRLRAVYTGTVGYEFSHIRDAEARAWLQRSVEAGHDARALSSDGRRRVLDRLSEVETFEQFLHQSFPGQRWFSLEGNDVLVPMLDQILASATERSVGSIVMGMAHRGRLNVLAHILGISYEYLLSRFMEGRHAEEQLRSDGGWMGDVKYHLGVQMPITSRNGHTVSLLSNPSHVELVDPVIAGAVRAVQEQQGFAEQDEDRALGILMHGDAAFAGQGIVAETLNLSGLDGYRIGGVVHIVVNNQIGFTTELREYGTIRYPSDLARGYDIPIVHVNADDVDACLAAAQMAFEFRQRFHTDFLINLVGYRRFGHNESDEPAYTQPQMYARVKEHPTARAQWAERLIQAETVTREEAERMVQERRSQLRDAMRQVTTRGKKEVVRTTPPPRSSTVHDIRTGVSWETLAGLNKDLHTYPEGFAVHQRLHRILERRQQDFDSGGSVEWAHAEALALASVLADGIPIRLTGQDSERGTFSQRHAVLHDVVNGSRYTPLGSLSSARAPFVVLNSPLSEMGALGYEYGYTLSAPGSLVLWEAQFGDFSNNAQSMIDEFITSSAAKWGQHSGLVLLLPHGQEGLGPNHSSAHLERFLQLAAEDNIQVASCSTSAQYFHLLRRQAALLSVDPRPLVVMTVKGLLRHPLAASPAQELSQGSFQPVLDDERVKSSPESVRRLVLCTGRIYVDLASSEGFGEADHVAVVRVEELYPFPEAQLAAVLAQYPRVREAVWVQEEPQNRGAWPYMSPGLHEFLGKSIALRYVGRPPRASVAEGESAWYKMEQQRIVQEALAAMPAARKR